MRVCVRVCVCVCVRTYVLACVCVCVCVHAFVPSIHVHKSICIWVDVGVVTDLSISHGRCLV